MFHVAEISRSYGKGLIANRNIEVNDSLIQEFPILACQNSWNRFYKYLACDHCLKPLESVSENLCRLAETTSINLPYQEFCPTLSIKKDFIDCADCKIPYCSIACKEEAFELYHSAICQSNRISDPSEPQNVLDEIWRQSHYPPETSTVMMLVRLFGLHLSALRSEKARSLVNILSHFLSQTIDSSTGHKHKLLRPHFYEKIVELHNKFVFVLENIAIEKYNFTKEKLIEFLQASNLEGLLSQEGFSSYLCMLGRNEQGISTSVFSVWIRKVNEHLENKDNDLLQNFTKVVDQIYDKLESTAGSFLDTEGVGLYANQHFINHSCIPNCEIRFSGENSQLSVICIKPIPKGEQITISYIDECLLERGRHTRRKYLAENYLFECNCERCNEEFGKAPSETSSEEEEEAEDACADGMECDSA